MNFSTTIPILNLVLIGMSIFWWSKGRMDVISYSTQKSTSPARVGGSLCIAGASSSVAVLPARQWTRLWRPRNGGINHITGRATYRRRNKGEVQITLKMSGAESNGKPLLLIFFSQECQHERAN